MSLELEGHEGYEGRSACKRCSRFVVGVDYENARGGIGDAKFRLSHVVSTDMLLQGGIADLVSWEKVEQALSRMRREGGGILS